jgi:ribosomal protein S18 acetylase RimI-like enzyme
MTLDMMSAPLLRAITPEDLPFLFRVYASTRQEELAPVPWTDEQKETFLRQQFEAQHAWWQEHYTGASFDVVLVEGKPAGRLYVDEWEKEIRIVDIALLPEYRGRRVGARLLHAVIARGDAAGKTVSIHVERNNPALRLYERLGFRLVEDKGVYLLMSRPPQE